jgi:hypothetical protein
VRWLLPAIATLIGCAAPSTSPAVALPHAAIPDARTRGWQLWRELTATAPPAWESWPSSDVVFAADAPLVASGGLAFRPPHDIRMNGRIVVPASEPLLYTVLLDPAAAAHVRDHQLASRAALRAFGAAIPTFPTAARAIKLVWFPIRAVGATDVPVWDGGWQRRVTVSADGAPGTVPIDRFYHRALTTP